MLSRSRLGPKQKNMKQDEYFLRFQQLCIGILAQSDNCMESQQQFKSARSVPELVTAWQRFWAGVLHEVPEQVIKAFADLYPVYRDDIIRAGVYYNEAPPVGIYPENPISPISPSDAATVPEASASGSRAVLFVYKTDNYYNQTLPRIRLAGLDADKTYTIIEKNVRVWKEPCALSGKQFTGRFLMEVGIEVPLWEDYASRVFLIQ